MAVVVLSLLGLVFYWFSGIQKSWQGFIREMQTTQTTSLTDAFRNLCDQLNQHDRNGEDRKNEIITTITQERRAAQKVTSQKRRKEDYDKYLGE